jgi:hypothetical protein
MIWVVLYSIIENIQLCTAKDILVSYFSHFDFSFQLLLYLKHFFLVAFLYFKISLGVNLTTEKLENC